MTCDNFNHSIHQGHPGHYNSTGGSNNWSANQAIMQKQNTRSWLAEAGSHSCNSAENINSTQCRKNT